MCSTIYMQLEWGDIVNYSIYHKEYAHRDFLIPSQHKYDELFNAATLHSLFDQYLPPNVGNNQIRALEFFGEQYSNFTKKYGIEKKLVHDQVQQSIREELRKLILHNADQDNFFPFDYVTLAKEIIANNYSNISYFLKHLEYIISEYCNNVDSIMLYLDEIVVQNTNLELFICNLLDIMFENIIELPKVNQQMYIIQSGFQNSAQSGHNITFLCIKSGDDYDVYMCNTGSGIQYHNTKGNLVKGVLHYKFNLGKMQKLIFMVDIINDHFYIDVDNFYKCLDFFLHVNTKQKISTKPDNNIAYIQPQLSGTCTYFSLYYMFRVLFYMLYNDGGQMFTLFDNMIKKTSANNLVDYIKVNFINNDSHLPPLYKSLIDNCNVDQDISIEIKKYYKDSIRKYLNLDLLNKDIPHTIPINFLSKSIIMEENLSQKDFNNVTDMLDMCLRRKKYLSAISYDAREKVICWDIIHIILHNRQNFNNDFFVCDDPIDTVNILLYIGKITYKTDNFFSLLLFLIVLHINEANRLSLLNIPKSSIKPEEFRLSFCCTYSASIYKFTTTDIDLIIKYRGLLTETLRIENYKVNITNIVRNINYKDEHFVRFILVANFFSHAVLLGDNYIFNIFRKYKFNFIRGTKSNDMLSAISFSKGLDQNIKSVQLIKSSNYIIDDFKLENFIGIMRTGDTIKLNHVIFDYNLTLNDPFIDDQIYDNYNLKFDSISSDNLNDVSRLIDIKVFEKILTNLHKYTNPVIIYVLAILIKTNIALARKYIHVMPFIPNNKIEDLCARLIMGCIKSEFIALNYKKVINFNTVGDLFTLYLYNLYLDNYQAYAKVLASIDSTDVLKKITKVYNLQNIESIVGKMVITINDNIILNDAYLEFSDKNLDQSEYLKKNYIVLMKNSPIDNNKININEEYELLHIARKTSTFAIKGNKLFFINNGNEYYYIVPTFQSMVSIPLHDESQLDFNSFGNDFLTTLASAYGSDVMFFYNSNAKSTVCYFINAYTPSDCEVYFIVNHTLNTVSVYVDNIEYKMCTDLHPLYINWIYQIPYCFIIEGNSRKRILVIENKLKNFFLYNNVSVSYLGNTEGLHLEDIDTKEYSRNVVHFIDFNFVNNCSLIFNDQKSLLLYTFYCIIYSKADCLKSVFPKYIAAIALNDKINKNTFLSMLNDLVKSGCNNMYRAYFNYLSDNKTYSEYKACIEYGYNSNYNLLLKQSLGEVKKVNMLTHTKRLAREYKPRTVEKEYDIEKYKDSKIYIHLKEYLKNYRRCVSDDEFEVFIMDELENELKQKKIEVLDKIFDLIIDTEDIYSAILGNCQYFYELLDLNSSINFISNAEAECSEYTKFYEMINVTALHDDEERPLYLILFEILFGNIIKKEQYNLFAKMCKEIDDKETYNVHQLLMGKGKTSVILPLLSIKYSNMYSSILVLQPSHLVKQTIDEIVNYNVILRDTFINTNGTGDIKNEDQKLIQISDSKTVQIEFLNNIINSKPNKAYDLIIIDEFDNLYNPLASELNIPVSEAFAYDNNREEIDNLVDFIIKFDGNIGIESKNMSDTLEYFNLIYNKDYGFPQRHSHKNNYLAVPYSAVNKPIAGSQFSELRASIVLTVLAYLKENKLRKIDFENIINHIKTFEDYTYFINSKQLKTILSDIPIDFSQFYNRIFDNNANVDSIYGYYKDYHSNKELIIWYIKKVVIPGIKNAKTQYNSSFLDIIGKNSSQRKIGFSGTINLNLPLWEDPSHEFTGIIDQKSDIGSTYFSFLALDSDDKNRMLHTYHEKDDGLHFIIETIKNNNYNCLIDTGAFLKDYTNDKVLSKLISENINRKYIIFITADDVKHVYDLIKNEIYEYNNQIYPTEDLFIYYDNQHTVGIDIKQPFVLKGLITIDKFNNFTEIAQGMYRLRNLNYGHTIDIMTKNNIHKNITRDTLLEHLLHMDDQYSKNSLKRLYLQNAKYLYRTFSEKVYIENKGENSIETLIKNNKNNSISPMLVTLNDLYLANHNNNVILEKEVEREKEKEVESEIKIKLKQIKIDKIHNINVLDKIFSLGTSRSYVFLQKMGIYFSNKFLITRLACNLNIDAKKYFQSETLGYIIVDDIRILLDSKSINVYEATNKDKNIIIQRKYLSNHELSDPDYLAKLIMGEKFTFSQLLYTLFITYFSNINVEFGELLNLFEDNYCYEAERKSLYPPFIKDYSKEDTFYNVIQKLNGTNYEDIYKSVTGNDINIHNPLIEKAIKNTIKEIANIYLKKLSS